MRGWPWAVQSALVAAALGVAWPALAQTDPLLAGAAYAGSDLSPITGVTALQFIPGKGLQRVSLDQPPPGDAPAPAATVPTATPASSPNAKPTRAVAKTSVGQGNMIDRARAALATTTPIRAPHWYMFISAGDRALGYSFVHSAISGWSSPGISMEHAYLQSKAQLGVAWQSGAETAIVSVMRSKDQALLPGLPALTENRVAVTLMHDVK